MNVNYSIPEDGDVRSVDVPAIPPEGARVTFRDKPRQTFVVYEVEFHHTAFGDNVYTIVTVKLRREAGPDAHVLPNS